MNNFVDSELVIFRNRTAVAGLRKGQPSFFLSASQSIQLFEEPTVFLSETFVKNGNTPSVHTWAAASDALKSWFQWLQAIRKNWKEASRQDRTEYRDAYLTSVSPRTGRPYEASTISSRMQVVRQFYEFASKQGWYEGDLGSEAGDLHRPANVPIDRDALSHTRRGSRTRRRDGDLPKTRPRVVVHPLQVTDLRNLIHFCGPRSARREGDLRPSRNRLFVDLAWVAGLRVEEIHSLTTLQFLNLHPDPLAPQMDHPLVILGKGSKTRQVAIPGWLVEDAISYINGERADALKLGQRSGRKASTSLLVGGATSTRPGKPISIRRLQQIVEQACLGIGLTKIVEIQDPETREIHQKVVQKHSVHDLRHTAAVLIYHAEKDHGNSEPWKKVQTQLGHSHLQTTIDTYLSHVEIFGQRQRFYDVRKMIGL